MDFARLQQMLGRARGGGAPESDAPLPDTSEKIQISSLSLLKMLKHGHFFTFRIYDFRIVIDFFCYDKGELEYLWK